MPTTPANIRRSAATDPHCEVEAGSAENMAVLRLDSRGLVCDCNRQAELLFESPRSQLVLQHVSSLLPELAEMELVKNGQPNMRLRFLSHIGHYFKTVAQGGKRFTSKIFLKVFEGREKDQLSLIVRPAEKIAESGAIGDTNILG